MRLTDCLLVDVKFSPIYILTLTLQTKVPSTSKHDRDDGENIRIRSKDGSTIAGSLSVQPTRVRSTSCQQQSRSRSTCCTSGTLLAWRARARTPRAWRMNTKPSWLSWAAKTLVTLEAQVDHSTHCVHSSCNLQHMHPFLPCQSSVLSA